MIRSPFAEPESESSVRNRPARHATQQQGTLCSAESQSAASGQHLECDVNLRLQASTSSARLHNLRHNLRHSLRLQASASSVTAIEQAEALAIQDGSVVRHLQHLHGCCQVYQKLCSCFEGDAVESNVLSLHSELQSVIGFVEDEVGVASSLSQV